MSLVEFIERPVTTTLKRVIKGASEPASKYAEVVDGYYTQDSKERLASLDRMYGLGLIAFGALIESRGRKVGIENARGSGRLIQELPVIQVVAEKIEAQPLDDVTKQDVLREIITTIERQLDGTGIPLDNILASNQRTSLLKGVFHETASNWFSNYAAGWGLFLGLLASPQFKDFIDTANAQTIVGLGLSALALGSMVRIMTEARALEKLGYSSSIVSTLLHHSGDPTLTARKRALKAAMWATGLDIVGAYVLPQHNFAMFIAVPYSLFAYPISVGLGDELFSAAYNLALAKGVDLGGFAKKIFKR